jgi:hypothetical protein
VRGGTPFTTPSFQYRAPSFFPAHVGFLTERSRSEPFVPRWDNLTVKRSAIVDGPVGLAAVYGTLNRPRGAHRRHMLCNPPGPHPASKNRNTRGMSLHTCPPPIMIVHRTSLPSWAMLTSGPKDRQTHSTRSKAHSLPHNRLPLFPGHPLAHPHIHMVDPGVADPPRHCVLRYSLLM